jgi:hypothetical protein
LRATGITWTAARGDDPLRIMQRAGHADFETTKIYLREAGNLSVGFGAVFRALPDRLLGIAPKSPGTLSAPRSSQKEAVRGGADENRTRDLLHAMQALSQLSYSPKIMYVRARQRYPGIVSTGRRLLPQPPAANRSTASLAARVTAEP